MSDLVEENVLFHHLLMGMECDSKRVRLGLLPEAGTDRLMIVDIKLGYYR